MPQRRRLRCSSSASLASFVTSSRSHEELLSVIFEPREINHAVALLDEEPYEWSAAARPADAAPAGGLIGRAVRRAEQIAAVEIEKYSFLPVEFHRDMRATVEISMHPPPVADHKGGCRLAEILDLEAHAGSRIRQRPRGADQPCCASHSLSSVTLPTQPRRPQERRLCSAWAPEVTAPPSTPAARGLFR